MFAIVEWSGGWSCPTKVVKQVEQGRMYQNPKYNGTATLGKYDLVKKVRLYCSVVFLSIYFLYRFGIMCFPAMFMRKFHERVDMAREDAPIYKLTPTTDTSYTWPTLSQHLNDSF